MTKVDVKYSTDKPPVWDKLVEQFNPNWERTAVAYGDTIHAKYDLPKDVDVHERIHLRQQGYTKAGAKKWYEKYLKDPTFRYEQELEAYREQYKYLSTTIKDRNELARKAYALATTLSGEMYGALVNRTQALLEITK